MQTVPKDAVVYAMSALNAPVLRVASGERVLFETWDALHGQLMPGGKGFDGLDWGRINPASGPVYINGAEPGDVLAVRIERIDVAEQGVVICGKDMGVMGHILEENTVRIVPIKGDVAHFGDLRLPLNKMVGVIGTAPAAGEEIPCGVPDYHGGNMDCKEVREGAVVLLPVNVPGALLALGDVHAVMADGEIGVSGLEVSGKVAVSVEVLKGKDLPLPMIKNDSHVMTLASHEDLDKAVDMAAANMVRLLTKFGGLKTEDAVMLTSLVADVRICQVVDPKKTVRIEFPVKYVNIDMGLK